MQTEKKNPDTHITDINRVENSDVDIANQVKNLQYKPNI